MQNRQSNWGYRVRASKYWFVRDVLIEDLTALLPRLVSTETLGGIPQRCLDVKDFCAKAHAQDLLALVDNSNATSGLCAAGLFGADLIYEKLDKTLDTIDSHIVAIGLTKKNGLSTDELGHLERYLEAHLVDEEMLELISSALNTVEQRSRAKSDCAQVVSRYLSCHYKIAEVVYVGLEGDRSKSIAARTLRAGFGDTIHFRLTNMNKENIEDFKLAFEHAFKNFNSSYETSLLDLKDSNCKTLSSEGKDYISDKYFELKCIPDLEKGMILAIEETLRGVSVEV